MVAVEGGLTRGVGLNTTLLLVTKASTFTRASGRVCAPAPRGVGTQRRFRSGGFNVFLR